MRSKAAGMQPPSKSRRDRQTIAVNDLLADLDDLDDSDKGDEWGY